MLPLCLILIFILPSPSITQTRGPEKIYKVAILPFLIHSQENLDYLREGINDIISSRITVEGRIAVIEQSVVERALYEERPMRLDETVAKKIGMRLEADYIVLGSITKIGDYISLDARLINITEEKPPLGVYTQHKGLDDVMVKIGDFAQDIGYQILGRRFTTGRPSGTKIPSFAQPKRETGAIQRLDSMDYKKSQSFGFEIKGLDIGDVDGDKKNEVVAMDDYHLYIFKCDGEKPNLVQTIEQGFEHNFLTLDVADVNRNGIAEIIVTSVVGDDLRSFILEFEEGKFKTITEKAGWYFRVLEHPKEGPILMGQKMGSEGIFTGPVYKFVWQKKSFERGPKIDFPKEQNIFGLALVDLRGEGKNDFILFGKRDCLTVLSQDGKELWRGSNDFGKTNIYYDIKKRRESDYRPQGAPPMRVYIPGRILIRDLDGDGKSEVIVSNNQATMEMFERARSFEKGEIYSLYWDDGSLTTNWKTREIKGYINDFQIKDADNDGEEDLVVAVVEPGGMLDRKSTSNILFFKLF
jgi:TolB-like protein